MPINKPEIKTLEDLKGKVISVNKGSNYEMWCRENEAKYGHKTEAYGTNTDAVQAVLSGRADANLAGHTVAAYAVIKKQTAAETLLQDQIRNGLVSSFSQRRHPNAQSGRRGPGMRQTGWNGRQNGGKVVWRETRCRFPFGKCISGIRGSGLCGVRSDGTQAKMQIRF